jgi:hypothetical protein
MSDNNIMINFRKLKVGSLLIVESALDSKEWQRIFAVLMKKFRQEYIFYTFAYSYDENGNSLYSKEYKTGWVSKHTLNSYCTDGKVRKIIY